MNEKFNLLSFCKFIPLGRARQEVRGAEDSRDHPRASEHHPADRERRLDLGHAEDRLHLHRTAGPRRHVQTPRRNIRTSEYFLFNQIII